jgi:hypothetical protein
MWILRKMNFECFMCEKVFVSFEAVNLHLVYNNLSANDRYICNQRGCQCEFMMLKQFHRHVYRAHMELFNCVSSCAEANDNVRIVPEERQTACCSAFELGGCSSDPGDSVQLLSVNHCAATFIAKLKPNSAVPASAVTDIISSVEELFVEGCIKPLKKMTVSVLESNHIDSDCEGVKTLLHNFDLASGTFDGLQTEYKQMKFFKQYGYYIEPVSYVVGQHVDTQRVANVAVVQTLILVFFKCFASCT